MLQRKLPVDRRRLVWRISAKAPMGEWVDLDAPVAAQPLRTELPEVSSGGWVVSSFDLLQGTDVVEGGDTVPDDLFDELFAPQISAPSFSR